MDYLHDGSAWERRRDTDLLRDVFQGKWRLRVLQEIVKGPVRLSQLRRAVPECSKKVLIDTLHGLEELGWIERHEYSFKLKRVEYSLTAEREQDVRRAAAIASREGASHVEERPRSDHTALEVRNASRGYASAKDMRSLRTNVRKITSCETSELRSAADRLVAALSDTDEDEIIAEFGQVRSGGG